MRIQKERLIALSLMCVIMQQDIEQNYREEL